MSSNNEQRNRIVFETDESAKNKLLAAYNQLSKAQEKLSKEARSLGSGFLSAIKGSKAFDNEQKDLNKTLNTSEKNIQDQIRALTSLEDKAKDAGRAVGDIPAASASSGGSIGGQVSDIRGAVATIGGGGAGSELASGIGDAVEAFGSLNPAVIASTVAIVALNAVMAYFTAEAEKQAAALTASLEAQRSVNEAVATGLTTTDAEARIAELERLRAAEESFLAEQEAAYNSAIEQLGALGFLAQQIAPQEQALADSIATSQSNIASYRSEINALTGELENGNIAANDIEAAESELAATRETEAQAAIAAAEASAARVAQLQEQQASLLENRAIAESNANASESLERRFAKEDEAKELRDHLDNLESIRAEGARKVEAIEAEIASLPAEQAKAIAEAEAKSNAQLAKLDSEYFKERIKAFKDFAKEQGRIATDTAKAAKRLAEQIADDLADAARSNDVVAFLKIQRDGQKELKQNAQDAKEEEKRRSEDFIAAQEEQAAAFEQRRLETLSAIEEERAKIAQSFAERRNQLEQQKQQEIQATQQALSNARNRYAQQEQLEAQQAQRNAQRIALREQQENAAFQRQLSAIQSKIAAEGSVEAAFMGGISRIVAAAAAIGKQTSTSAAAGFSKAPGMAGSYTSPYQSGGFTKGSASTMNVSMVVGDVATGSQVSAALNQAFGQYTSMQINAVNRAQG